VDVENVRNNDPDAGSEVTNRNLNISTREYLSNYRYQVQGMKVAVIQKLI
jgi:hypothetical protein